MIETFYNYGKTFVDINQDEFFTFLKAITDEKYDLKSLERISEIIDDFCNYSKQGIFIIDNSTIRTPHTDEYRKIFYMKGEGKIFNTLIGNHPINEIRTKVQKVEEIPPELDSERSTVEKFLKDEKKLILIKREDITDDFWRKVILFIFFSKGTPEITTHEQTCPLCRTRHNFGNVRFFLPVNIMSEKFVNFNSHLSNETSYRICPYCFLILLKTCTPTNIFKKSMPTNNLFIKFFPLSSDINSISETRMLLKEYWKNKEFKGALQFLVYLPDFVNNLFNKNPTKTPDFKFHIFLTGHKKEKAEQVYDNIIIERFGELREVGKKLTPENYGGILKLLSSYVQSTGAKDKIDDWRFVFSFISTLLVDITIDFRKLKMMLRSIITAKEKKSNNERNTLTGYKYIHEFLGVNDMEKEQVTRNILESGRRIGMNWKGLIEEKTKIGESVNENRFKSIVLKLDSISPSNFQKVLRKMVAEMTDYHQHVNLSDMVLTQISSDRYWRDVFMTGVYFGYFASGKQSEKELITAKGD